MADQPNSQPGGLKKQQPLAGTRSPIQTRSRTRNSAQFEGCPSTHNGIALDGQQPHPGDVLKRNLESDDVPRQSKKHKGHIWVFKHQGGHGDRQAPQPEKGGTSGQQGSCAALESGGAGQQQPQPGRSAAKGACVGRGFPRSGATTGSCASSSSSSSSSRRRSSRVGKLGGGGPGRGAAAMSGADQGAASSSSNHHEDAAQPSAASRVGGTSGTADSESDDNEMGRLQALLEARGLPPHLFGALGPRMQHFLHRSIGSSASSRAQQLLSGLQCGEEGQQLQATMEMCQLLVMGNEDTLAGFPVKQVVPALVALLALDHNFDLMNHACRALTYMMEALPRSSAVVVDALPAFLEKLQVIQCMDVAEQSLTALEMLSRRHSKAILHARGVSACLTYLDFFSISAQRAALTIAANCCQSLGPEEFPLVGDSVALLSGRLSASDRKSVESACLALARLVDCLAGHRGLLQEVASQGLLQAAQGLLALSPPPVSSATFVMVVRMLAVLCAACPHLAVQLLKNNIAETLRFLLMGNSDPLGDDIELVPRSPQELYEITSLIAELMPVLPQDGIFVVDSLLVKPNAHQTDAVLWKWRDDRGLWHPYSSIDCKIIEAAHQSGEDEISLSTMGKTYTIDFNLMQQINEDTGTARLVQRVNNQGVAQMLSGSGSGNTTAGSGGACSSPSPSSSSSCSSGGGGAGPASSASAGDPRGAWLREQSSMGGRAFLGALFGALHEVYSSSAGPAVRHRCLRALLRMVHCAPAELLAGVLRYQLVASHLAAMLSSQDLHVVVGALQMADLLMQKLPEVFGVHFRREGVMHRVKQLAQEEVTLSAASSGTGASPGAAPSKFAEEAAGSSRDGHTTTVLWGALAPVPAHLTPMTGTGDSDHFAVGAASAQMRLSDVLKRKRAAKRSNASSRKVRTEEGHRGENPLLAQGRRSVHSARDGPFSLPPPPPEGSGGTPPAGGATSGAPLSPGGAAAGGGGGRGGGRLSSAAARTTSFLASLNPSRWGRWANPPLVGHLSSQEYPMEVKSNMGSFSGNKEKIKLWIHDQAKKFDDNHFTSDQGSSHPALNTLNRLLASLDHLDALTDHGLQALQEIRAVLLEGDVSSFEVIHSGLVSRLLSFLTMANCHRDDRLRTFLQVFLHTPQYNPDVVYDQVIPLPGPLSALVQKLNACVSQLEQFPVKVHDLPGAVGGGRGTSALKFFNTHQLKCNLQRHPSCSNLRQWRGGPVKIDPLALVQAIERYLVIRGYGRIRDEDDGGSDEENSDEDIDDTMAAMMINQGQARHKLQFLMGDHPLPYGMTVYQAIRQYSGASPDGHETDTDSENPMGYANIWVQTHTIWYRPVPEDDRSGTPSGSSGRGGQSSSSAPGLSSRRNKSSSGSKSMAKKKDDLWNEGVVPETVSLLHQHLSATLPESVTIQDASLQVITLLRVVYALSQHWGHLYELHSYLPALPRAEFVNSKLTAKANRQLQDPLAIMTGNIPSWLTQVAYACPFLFPFETRHLLFYTTSFDRDRALQRLLDMTPDLSGSDNSERVTPRLDRRKRTVARDDLLKQAEVVMQDLGSSRALLEIQYENEVGSGLGPTLEFYALVSRELQRADLDMWRGETVSVLKGGEEPVKYVHSGCGLFPSPLGRNAKVGHVGRVRSRFKLLGKFVAKALMDSRMLDLPLSLAMYKWMLGQESSLSLADMDSIDPALARSLRQLHQVVQEKRRVERDRSLSPASVRRRVEALQLDGCLVELLGLDFTLPGQDSLELRRGGASLGVSVHNLDQYLRLTVHWAAVEGVRRQMDAFREGFEAVFPLAQLQLFYADELEQLFCGSGPSLWDVKSLMDCCRPDHGYSHDSRAIKFLFEILSNYLAEEQRAFLQFVTGSPRLPVGGFKSLSPPLTIVRKTFEPNENPDDYLPSVMTCVNYLKLPDYSDAKVMRERLRIAASEGQHSFHLS
ncbi:LOW QUALITY PROTEIN: E3 ubiquitin-protein ligase TRIP12 [Ixodes scapularis]|nr:LOW QUALITY PROTEIN: E3 ubiquitin-protein ligase TRIP12 [Ixodes scapularis]